MYLQTAAISIDKPLRSLDATFYRQSSQKIEKKFARPDSGKKDKQDKEVIFAVPQTPVFLRNFQAFSPYRAIAHHFAECRLLIVVIHLFTAQYLCFMCMNLPPTVYEFFPSDLVR